MKTKHFDWCADPITQTTRVTSTYWNTQDVQRFLQSQYGASFRFNRRFMAWIKDGTEKAMGDVAEEWLRRQRSSNDD